MTLKEMLGQKLVFGFHGTTLSPEFKALIREYKIGNVILFLRNVESAAQLRQLCTGIREFILEETGYPPFIIIDQEGGMVIGTGEGTGGKFQHGPGIGREFQRKQSGYRCAQLRG